jgi:hypothetical protein
MDDVAVVYESKTGTTRRLALAVGDELFGRGIRCTTYPTAGVTAAAIADTNVFILVTSSACSLTSAGPTGRGWRTSAASSTAPTPSPPVAPSRSWPPW